MNNIKVLTEAQRTLVEENIGLISYAMKKLPIYLFDSPEDAFQIGTIGLMKAARSFEPSRNILFSTYAIPCIVNELRMALRHINSWNPPGRTASRSLLSAARSERFVPRSHRQFSINSSAREGVNPSLAFPFILPFLLPRGIPYPRMQFRMSKFPSLCIDEESRYSLSPRSAAWPFHRRHPACCRP